MCISVAGAALQLTACVASRVFFTRPHGMRGVDWWRQYYGEPPVGASPRRTVLMLVLVLAVLVTWCRL